MNIPPERKRELDLAWVAGQAALIVDIMNHMGTAPTAEDLEEERWRIHDVTLRIKKRVGPKIARMVLERIQKITGKLELPQEG